MTDLALRWSNAAWSADLFLDGARLATDDGLQTAIIVSLMTNRRADADDPLPAPGERGGWWGDVLAGAAGDRIGSRLWLLAREKRLQSVIARAREYVIEALAWLIEDGVARTVEVSAEAQGEQTLAFGVFITRPEGPGRQRFDFTWEATAHAVQ
jgi:phage gp46-like protein